MKNKIAPPFRDAEFDIMFDRGISYEGDLLDLAVLANVVEKSGAWYNYKATRLGQGRENSKQFLFDNPDLAQEIREKILSARSVAEGLSSPLIPPHRTAAPGPSRSSIADNATQGGQILAALLSSAGGPTPVESASPAQTARSTAQVRRSGEFTPDAGSTGVLEVCARALPLPQEAAHWRTQRVTSRTSMPAVHARGYSAGTLPAADSLGPSATGHPRQTLRDPIRPRQA